MRSSWPTLLIVAIVFSSCAEKTPENAAIAGAASSGAVNAIQPKPKQPSLFAVIKSGLDENAAKAKAKQEQRRMAKSKANPDDLALSAPANTTAAKPVKTVSSSAANPPSNNNSQDLAKQLREPDMLNRIDVEDPSPNASSPPKTPGGKPVIIKGDAAPELPGAPKTIPAPPIEKP